VSTSENIVVQAPMSYTGSMRRLHNLMPAGMAWLAWATCLVPLAWMVVTAWYICFGLLLVPYRLVRRGSRKRKLEALRHQEMLAVLAGRQ
jgi:hypothetical protein